MFYALQPVGHGHVTCSLTLTEKHRHMVSENMVLRNISTNRGGVTQGWMKLHAEWLHDSCSSTNIFFLWHYSPNWA